MSGSRLQKLVIGTVALHSLILGVGMLVMPKWVLSTVGWDYNGPLFFPAQTGVFLVILSGAYFAGIWHIGFAWLIVLSKAAAVVFLAVAYALGSGPVIVVLAAFLDGLMGLAVAATIFQANVAASRLIYESPRASKSAMTSDID